MDNRTVAKFVNKAFRLLGKQTTARATSGSRSAALEVMREMTAHYTVLANLGYTNTDNGRLVKCKGRKRSLASTLAIQASEGDAEAAKKLFELINAEENYISQRIPLL